MKKAVVLLLTLSVTALLSVFLYQSLNNIDNVIKQKETSSKKTETIAIAKNINEQILKFFDDKNFKDKIDEILPLYSIDLSYKDNMVIINYLDYYTKSLYIYDKDFKKQFYKFNNYLNSMGIKENDISTHKQLNYIINSYLLENEDKELEEIKNDLTFLKGTDYYECEYTFTYLNVESKVRIIFEKEEVVDFEIWN